MIRIIVGVLIVLFLIAPPQVSRAGTASDREQCDGDDDAAAIASCTRLIERGGLSAGTIEAAYYSRGLAYYDQSKYDLAIADYTKAIALNPKDVDAYVNRGAAYNQTGQYDLAIADYTTAIQIKPRDYVTYSDRCAAYSHKQAYDLALADCTKALSLNPYDAATLDNRANIYSDTGKPDLAIADLNRGITQNPTNATLYQSRGLFYENAGNYDQAIVDYTQAIELKPDTARAYNGRGRVELLKQQYDLSLADFTKAIALKADFADAYANRGYTYFSVGKYDFAITDFRTATALDPKDANAFIFEAKALVHQKDYDGAIEAYSKAINLQPQAAELHLDRARTYLLKGNFPAARADAEAEMKITPDKPVQGASLLISIDIAENKHADAVVLARSLVARFPDDYEVHINLGLLLGCLDGGDAPCTFDVPAAFAEFSRSIELHPTAFAYAMRSQLRERTDDTGRHADLDAALRIEPDNRYALMTRAALYLYEKDYAKGLADIDAVLDQEPDDPQALNLRVLILGGLKRYDEQMAVLDAELKRNPGNADALNSLCWALAVRGTDLGKALDSCNAAIKLSPKAYYYDSRALVEMRQGRFDDALIDYNTALAGQPDLASSLYGRGLIKIKKGQVEAGKADMAQSLAINPKAGDTFKETGLAPN